jgi:hypothetical protein
VSALINQLFDADKIGAEELAQVKKLIARKEREARGK